MIGGNSAPTHYEQTTPIVDAVNEVISGTTTLYEQITPAVEIPNEVTIEDHDELPSDIR